MFRKRQDGSVGFYLNWDHYNSGFSNLSNEILVTKDKEIQGLNLDNDSRPLLTQRTYLQIFHITIIKCCNRLAAFGNSSETGKCSFVVVLPVACLSLII